ncbi:XTP/dITP diphosphatase [Alteribacillus iranensis]|uniref:dITP/XTP pyrophosphatase n=1 Tax=Alteribacillus iranensis TaxID=930128 RepID=A0A1I2CM12_9BACI|nr:XTP/dITP diphosphatase [Alteribacillus iranensis]SFE69449.1 XTP/dITP diphosphohydrolase [Alteribacillus iranensis]
MLEIIIATKNKGKIREFQDMVGGEYLVQSLLERPFPDIDETGSTFEENAVLKAEAVSKAWDVPTIADDSGLEIDTLHGQPGIFSARYAGPEKDDTKNIEKVLKELQGVPFEKRDARFVCVIAAAVAGNTYTFRGTCEGKIALEPNGDNGFGYDPIFYLPEKGRTMAELTSDEKNHISHRYHAMHQLKLHWKEIFK